MQLTTGRSCFAMLVIGGLLSISAVAGPYDAPASNAAAWLLQQRNLVDGSWGATDEVKYVQTSEAVLALAALNRRTPEYYAGLTWLQNHSPDNIDFKARRILALQVNGNSIGADLQYLQGAQNLMAPGNSGWGLSSVYQGSALDTALSLQAYNQAGVSTGVSNALTYLINTQLAGTDKGWVIGQEAASDPATTAQVLPALIPLQASNGALPAVIANGFAALNAKVTSTSPVAQQALAAMANFRSNPNSPAGIGYLNNIASTQGGNGSWGTDVYVTALAIRALAAGMGRDLATQKQVVVMTDAKLRAAVNEALGRSALNALNVGELGQLTTLNIANRNIASLAGLQYATHLTYLDASNNNIADFSPVAGLTQATIVTAGNPGSTQYAENEVPTLPEWGMILMTALLMLIAVKSGRNGSVSRLRA